MHKFKIKQNLSLLDALIEINPGMSKQKAKNILEHHELYVNGKKEQHYHKAELKEGDQIELKLISEKTKVKKVGKGAPNGTKIIWEDDHLILAFKPAGIISSGADPASRQSSFHKVLENYLTEQNESKQRLWIIHRLDREVEGLILFAKSDEVNEQMKAEWKTVTKKYWAITEGKPDPEEGMVKSWLKDSNQMKVVSLKKEVEGAKWAETKYHFLKSYGNYHLVEVELMTGRKNQIRVHLSEIGCPIVGDRKYGADASVIRQIRLAAIHIGFKHPITGQPLTFRHEPGKYFFTISEKQDEKYKSRR